MTRLPVAIALVVIAHVVAHLAEGAKTAGAEFRPGETVPLTADDLANITLQVMHRSPMLSSAPGIKFASVQRSVRSTDIASVVFYPHAESNGVKTAFQVRCSRQPPTVLWTCDEIRLRRYLRLATQDFEVRVTPAEVTTEVALALIEATRDVALASATSSAAAPSTAIMILPDANAYLVTWGSAEGQQELEVRAQLRSNGDPARPEDWQTRVFRPRD